MKRIRRPSRSTKRTDLAPECLEARCVMAAGPIISEVMAVNEGGLHDGFERSPDWIEIFNPADTPASLAGFSLTDDPSLADRWTLPAVSIDGGGYLVVFASGGIPNTVPLGTADPLGYLHADFKLDRQGEFLALLAPDGQISSRFGQGEQGYPEQVVNVSYGFGLNDDGSYSSTPGYQMQPSPGSANVPAANLLSDFVRDTKTNVDRGFYDSPIDVEITTQTVGAVIRYTLDGSAPTLTHGLDYTSAIHIDHTTLVRVAAFRDGFVPTNVDTQSYLFLADVLTQDGAGLPATWGTFPFGSTEAAAGSPVPANYEIDPDVVNDIRYHDELLADLRSLPTISLVLDPDDLWSEEEGIYANTTKEGVEWERPGSIEMISENGTTEFQIDAGVRVHGGFGRRPSGTAKHSFRLFFKGDYGDAKLRYPLFGEDQVDEFNTVVLRANYNYSWARGDRGGAQTGKDYTLVSDRWGAVAQADLGGLSPNGNFVHLYVNGLYWGVYNPTERPDASFQASHQGGLVSEYDVQSHDGLVDGTTASWNELRKLVRQRPIDEHAVEQLLDVDNFIDYMILNQFGGNDDWPQNNWYASRHRVDGGKWQFHSWDTEFFFIDLNKDRINSIDSSGPGELYTNLLRSDEFRMRFADRIQMHLLGDGALTATRNIARLNQLIAPLTDAVVAESARWGDAWMNQVSPPRTRDDDWLPRLEVLRNTYFPKRNAIVIRQYERRGLFPSTPAASLSHGSGPLAPGTPVSLSAAAANDVIYYTLDGSDPRLPGGSVAPQALLFGANPIAVEQSQTLRVRVLRGTEWSPIVAVTYEVTSAGDFDRNAVLDAIDIDLICAAIQAGSTDASFDLNADDAIDAMDYQFLVGQLLHTTQGDANLDGVFNSADLVLVFQAGQYEDGVAHNSGWASGDWNCDGEFSTSDLVAAFQVGAYVV